jgi:hypothetical protein
MPEQTAPVSGPIKQPPPPAANPAVRSGDTVCVACALQNGLILRLFDMQDRNEPTAHGGSTPIKVAIPRHETWRLNGPAVDIAKIAAGRYPEFQMVGSYALTPGIPRDFWEEWLSQNRDSDIVRKKIVFAGSSENNARAEAKDAGRIRSGLEPIDPDDPKRIGPDVARIERGTRS